MKVKALVAAAIGAAFVSSVASATGVASLTSVVNQRCSSQSGRNRR